MSSSNMQYNEKMHILTGPTGKASHLSPQCHKLLNLLLEKNGEFVSREELRDTVWGHDYVSDDAINHAIARLRSKIKMVEGECLWNVESLPGIGYRLCAHQVSFGTPFKSIINTIKSWWSAGIR